VGFFCLFWVTPFVAYEMPLGPGIIGARAEYEFWFTNRKQVNSISTPTDSTETGGQTFSLTAFYEANIGKFTYGGAVTYTSAAESKSTPSGGIATGNKDSTTGTGVQFYIPIHFTPTLTLLPVVGLSGNTYTASGAALDSSALLYIGTGARFIF
jgi:hypothetical protein